MEQRSGPTVTPRKIRKRKATEAQRSLQNSPVASQREANGAARERWCGPRDVRAGGAVRSSQNRLLGNGKF